MGEGGAAAPPRATKKMFLGIFVGNWNEAKMGLNLARCTPADEINR